MSIAPAPHRVSKALIYQGPKILLQLRDDKPDIVYPNLWELSGGSIDPGESPEEAIKRELTEELSWTPATARYILTWEGEEPGRPWVVIYMFAIPLTVEIDQLELHEGQDLQLFTLEELLNLQLVPHIREVLPPMIAAIAEPALTAAWHALA